MGENKHIEEIDAFTKKHLKELPIEAPSADFTQNIIHKIAAMQSEKLTIAYKPLISRKTWFIVIALIAGILFVPFKSSEKGWFTVPEINFSFLEKINVLNSLSISNTTFIITLIFGVLMSIQIVYLKGFFEKRFH